MSYGAIFSHSLLKHHVRKMQPKAAPMADANIPPDEAEQAKNWWSIREKEVERDLAAGLQRRMEAQRAQLYAFKTEQSKWEHELQLRISKYAYDRKLLSEHNVELKEKILRMEEKFVQYQREMDQQVQYVIELEGMLHENEVNKHQMEALKQDNEELHRVQMSKLREWKKFYRDEKEMSVKEMKLQQEELLTELEKLLTISKNELVRYVEPLISGEQVEKAKMRRKAANTDEKLLIMRVKELEAMCKQKDQTVYSLRTIVEQQETVFDEKVKIVTAKYDQVKTINMALQKRLMHVVTEASGKS